MLTRTYTPLTTLTFAIEYRLVQDDPFLYHLNNLILHLMVISLIYVVGLQLRLSSLSSAFAALIFGIHPIHVESVAWITERKDVLYSFFYLLSIICYIQYIKNKNAYIYGFAVFLALLSIASKAMALSLPSCFICH